MKLWLNENQLKSEGQKFLAPLIAELYSLHIAGSLWVQRLSQITEECGSFPQQEGPLPRGLGPEPWLNLTATSKESSLSQHTWNCYDVENTYLLN